jgi:PIN domain nuclease of toxin-antitoxin system
MRLLLDTHTFIWFIIDSTKLSNAAKLLIENEGNEKLISTASIWEIAIKQCTGKLNFALPFRSFIKQQLSLNSIELLNINLAHLDIIANLPFHHRGPFDRLLIA